jgi:hypothetical protein
MKIGIIIEAKEPEKAWNAFHDGGLFGYGGLG